MIKKKFNRTAYWTLNIFLKAGLMLQNIAFPGLTKTSKMKNFSTLVKFLHACESPEYAYGKCSNALDRRCSTGIFLWILQEEHLRVTGFIKIPWKYSGEFIEVVKLNLCCLVFNRNELHYESLYLLIILKEGIEKSIWCVTKVIKQFSR